MPGRNDDRLEDLEFPLGGLNLLAEFQEQPPGTTADCENVRGMNPDSLRERGGSRAGLLKYSPYRIPANLSLDMTIQHLNIIVDPQAEAMRMVFIVPGEDWVADPLNPGTFVPPGGSGNPPNPNAPQPPKPSAAMTINVTMTPGPGNPDVTLRTVTDVAHSDSRTGSSGYAFTNLPDIGGNYQIECDNDLGFQFPFEVFVNGVSQGTGSSGNNLSATVPWVAATSVSVEFVIHNG